MEVQYCTLWGSGLRVAVGESLAHGLYAFWLAGDSSQNLH